MKTSSYANLERFIGRYSIGRDSDPLNETGSRHFVRIKVVGGILTSDQLRGIADLATKYGRGKGEITDRQDIHLHWIEAEDALEIFSMMDKLGFTTDMCGQGFTGARYGDARNIVCCPACGIERDELLNPYPIVKSLSDFFVGNPDFLDMPKKFKMAMCGCGSDCVRAEINDLGLVAVKKGDIVGFTMLVGGSVGTSLPGPTLAKTVPVFIRPEDAHDVAVATLEIHRDNGNRESKGKARFKWLLNELGLEKFRKILEEKIGKELESYNGPIFANDKDHHGVQPQGRGGYYVNIPLIGGLLTDSEMVNLSELADKYGSGELRFTPQQNVLIPNVRDKDTLLRELERSGFRLKGSTLRWNSIACASDFCGKTKEPHAKSVVKDIVDHLETRFGHALLHEARFRIHASGCPNNCCASQTADIGLDGRRMVEKDSMKQCYNIQLGGGLGIESATARLVAEKIPAGELKLRIGALLNCYLKTRLGSESLRSFCNRHTPEELRSFLD